MYISIFHGLPVIEAFKSNAFIGYCLYIFQVKNVFQVYSSGDLQDAHNYYNSYDGFHVVPTCQKIFIYSGPK